MCANLPYLAQHLKFTETLADFRDAAVQNWLIEALVFQNVVGLEVGGLS